MKHPVTNQTAMPIYVAGLMIPPGETRHFDIEQIPPEFRPAPAVTAPQAEQLPPNPLADLAAHNAAEIIENLSDLSSDDLAALMKIEEDGRARKTVLAAISAEHLKRVSDDPNEA